MRRLRKVVEAFEDMRGAVADGVEFASELETEFSHTINMLEGPELKAPYSTKQGAAQSRRSHTDWREISPGVFARPTPRERIIRRVRRAD